MIETEAISSRATPSWRADWVEVNALISPSRSVSRREVEGLPSIDDIDEEVRRQVLDDDQYEDLLIRPLDPDIDEPVKTAFNDDLLAEIVHRSETLGDRYPFRLDARGEQWRLEARPDVLDRDRADFQIYLCGLLVTASRWHIASKEVDTNQRLSALTQQMACLCAGSIVGGAAYWFGYPRPGGTNAVAAIKDLMSRMCIPESGFRSPPWENEAEKDLGVDVVAWQRFADGRDGYVVVVGQVASGATNWEMKPVHQDAKELMLWIGQESPKSFTEAQFIPWVQNIDDMAPPKGRSHLDWSEDRAARRWIHLGIVIDRLRMALLIPPAEQLPIGVDVAWLDDVVQWVATTLQAPDDAS